MEAQRQREPEIAHSPAVVPEPVELTRFACSRYSKMHRLTHGGGVELYLADDQILGRQMTLGLLHPDRSKDADAVALLEHEARLLARIDHPQVAGVLDYGHLGHERCLTLTAVGAQTLDEYLSARPRLPSRARLDLLTQAAEGLAAVHRAGVLHRNFSPACVRVDDQGAVRLVHFELARLADPGPGAWERDEPSFDGNPATMAPEARQQGRRDARGDQYSFCVVAWKVLTGARPPADAHAAPRAAAHTQGTRRVLAVLARGLSKDPQARWADMDELLVALRLAKGGQRRRFARFLPRRTTLGLAVLLAAAALSMHVGLASASNGDAAQTSPHSP